jgi:phosphate:Na+ symporter
VGISEMANKYASEGIKFSDAGMSDLKEFYEMIRVRLETVLGALQKEDRSVADDIIRNKSTISKAEIASREKHFARLTAGGEDTARSSTMHLDLLTSLKRIDTFSVKMAHEIIEQYKF